jgi:hypothetical protein
MKSIVLIVSLSGVLGAASWRDDLDQAGKLREAGEIAAAQQLYDRVLEQANDLNAAQLNALGMELAHEARFRDAERAYRQSLAAWDKLGLQTASSRSITAENLGVLLQTTGRYAEAEPLLLERLQQAETTGESASPDAARAAALLAVLYQAWGQPGKAESFALQAEKRWGALDGERESRAANRRILAAIRLDEQRYPEAEELLRGLINDLSETALVGVYTDLATAELRQDHLAEAEPWALRAVTLARRLFPAEHPTLGKTLNNLAQIERFQGHYLGAERDYREAIDIWQRGLGPQSLDTAKGLMNLAALYHDRGREAGAEDLYRRAAAIFETSYGKAQPLTLIARNELGEVLRAQRRYSESERLSRETLGPLESSLGARDSRVIRALTNYARLLEDTRRGREATAVRGRIQTIAAGFRNPNP